MEYDLFQLESNIITEKKDLWVVTKVTKGVEMTHFQASMGLWDFFLEIPDEQFNLGHWSLGHSLLKKQDAKT